MHLGWLLHAAPTHQGIDVETESLVDDLVIGPNQWATLVGRRRALLLAVHQPP